MSKLFYLLIGLLSWSNLFSLGLFCKFEEVYQNGEVQTGHLLIQESDLRYEYFDPNLFTIIYVNRKLILIDNQDKNKFQMIEEENSIVPEIINIYKDFPDTRDNYNLKGYDLSLEKQHSSLFIKRLAIKSENINSSIYFFECKNSIIDKFYFEFNPFKDYVSN